jgi:hypothetical protein
MNARSIARFRVKRKVGSTLLTVDAWLVLDYTLRILKATWSRVVAARKQKFYYGFYYFTGRKDWLLRVE